MVLPVPISSNKNIYCGPSMMSQRRSLQLLRGPSRWKMTKLETWKDSTEAVKTRPVGSIPWGLYLETSLVVHSAYLIMKSKDLIRTLAPCPRRHSTTSGLPASTAKCRAVYLWLVIVLTFSPLAIIALMTPTWPFWAATWIPLAPCLSKSNNSYLSHSRTIFIFNTKNLLVGHKQRNTSFM